MEDSIRWGKYYKRGEAQKENSLQHSYKATLLASIVIDNERKYSTRDFDAYLVLKATAFHDIGEIPHGDVVHVDKTIEGDKKEYDYFRELMSQLPNYEELDLAYNLQNIKKPEFEMEFLKKHCSYEILLFEAIESLGYITFAYRQYRKDKQEKIFVQVLRNHKDIMNNLADQLPGVRKTFYTKEMHENVNQFLEKYDGQFLEQKGE